MQASTVKQAVKMGAKVAQVGVEAERLRENVTHAVEDTIKSAKRAVQQGRYAAQDCVDEATYSIKRHPLQSVGVALGIGFAFGAVFGLAISRLPLKAHCCEQKDPD